MARIITEAEQAQVDVLMQEIHIINDLISGEQDNGVVEELKQERVLLIVQVNRIYGTEHIAAGSKISEINNDLYKV